MSASAMSNLSMSKKQTTLNNGAIYIRHDIDVKSMSGSSRDEEQGLEMGNVHRDNSHEGLVFPAVAR